MERVENNLWAEGLGREVTAMVEDGAIFCIDINMTKRCLRGTENTVRVGASGLVKDCAASLCLESPLEIGTVVTVVGLQHRSLQQQP